MIFVIIKLSNSCVFILKGESGMPSISNKADSYPGTPNIAPVTIKSRLSLAMVSSMVS